MQTLDFIAITSQHLFSEVFLTELRGPTMILALASLGRSRRMIRVIPKDRSPDRSERPNGRRGQCREAKQSGALRPATEGATNLSAFSAAGIR